MCLQEKDHASATTRDAPWRHRQTWSRVRRVRLLRHHIKQLPVLTMTQCWPLLALIGQLICSVTPPDS